MPLCLLNMLRLVAYPPHQAVQSMESTSVQRFRVQRFRGSGFKVQRFRGSEVQGSEVSTRIRKYGNIIFHHREKRSKKLILCELCGLIIDTIRTEFMK